MQEHAASVTLTTAYGLEVQATSEVRRSHAFQEGSFGVVLQGMGPLAALHAGAADQRSARHTLVPSDKSQVASVERIACTRFTCRSDLVRHA